MFSVCFYYITVLMELIMKLFFLIFLFLISSSTAPATPSLDQASALAAWRSARSNRTAPATPSSGQANARLSWINDWSPGDVKISKGTAADDVIHSLPGEPHKSPFLQFGGYITVDQRNGRSLYYYFAEAAEDPASKPLVLWLNGGN